MKISGRLFALLISVAIATTIGITASASASGIGVELNGTPLVFDQPPISKDGRTLVPLRVIFEALGATVNYEQSTKTITAVRHDVTVTLQIGSNSLYRNGQWVYLDVSAQSIGGRTMVPTRAVAESFGAVVGWEAASKTVTISFIPVERVELNFGALTMERYSDAKLTPSIYPSNATNKAPQFSSSNPGVATVSNDGVIRAVGAGTAMVTCTVDGISAYSEVTVIVPVTGISVTTDRKLFETGEQFRFSVQIFPEDATDKEYTLDVSGAALLQPDTVSVNRGGEITVTATASNGVRGELLVNAVDLAAYADEIRQEFYFLVNNHRRANGLRELAENKSLQQYADIRSAELRILFSHTRPDGSEAGSGWHNSQNTMNTRFAENAASARTIDPNDARASADRFFSSWRESSGHNRHMLYDFSPQITMALGLDLKISNDSLTSPGIWATGY